MELRFEWDERKNLINIKKHGVAFDEAENVFFDPECYEMYDEIHSFYEKRWIIVGLAGLKILKVVFTERNGIIRIISARKADKYDKEAYFYGYGTKNSKF